MRMPLKAMLFVLWPLLLACFFVTANPYEAIHSGSGGFGETASQVSSQMALNQALLIGIGLTSALIYLRAYVRIPVVLAIGFAAVVMSGIWTGVIFSRPQSYAYDIAAMTLLSSLAAVRSHKNLKSLYAWSAMLFALSVLAAFVQPDRWGMPNVEFSRLDRGEFTLAYYLGCYLLIPQLSFAAKSVPAWLRAIGWVAICALAAATFTRTTAYLCIAPGLIYALVKMRKSYSLPIIFFALAFLSYFVFSITEEMDFVAINFFLTGRLSLWEFYWQQFLANPIFGGGAFLLERANGYTSAVSEIGVLKTFGEYGVVWGGIQLWIVVVSCIEAVRALRSEDSMAGYCGLVVLTVAPIFLLEGFTRILAAGDAIFWYAALYLYMRKAQAIVFSFKHLVHAPPDFVPICPIKAKPHHVISR